MTILRRSARYASITVLWCVIVFVGAVLLAAVVVPKAAGATPYTVLTGSMDPTYPPGTLVIVRPVDGEEVQLGDVITFQIESGRPAVATHRVIGVSITTEGERTFQTQGDANQVPDAEPVVEEQIRGSVWYSLPYLGHVNAWLGGQNRVLAVNLVVGALVAYAAVMFWGVAFHRRSGRGGRHARGDVTT